MKRFVSLLAGVVLALSLTACGSPARDIDQYSVGETENGWAIVYENEDGTMEEIARMGNRPQPLVLQKGRFYYVQNGAVVSVDSEGEDRQSCSGKGLGSKSVIAYADESGVYCVEDKTDLTCVHVPLDLTSSEEIPIPRKFRSIDYEALPAKLLEMTGAKKEKMRVIGARMVLDSNGCLASMRLETMSYAGNDGVMPVWDEGVITLTNTTEGAELNYENFHTPYTCVDYTMEKYLRPADLCQALETIDTQETALKLARDGAESFGLVYWDDAWEEAAEKAPVVSPSGEETASSGVPLIMGQIGGVEPSFTDEDGLAMGNLVNITVETNKS